MKKLISLFLTLTIVFLSMTISVFAWFSTQNQSSAHGLNGQIESPGLILDLEIENSEIYVGDMVRDLTYLSTSEYTTLFSSLSKYGSFLKITVLNKTLQSQGKINISTYTNDHLSGPINGFKYMAFTSMTGLIELILANENKTDLDVNQLFIQNNNQTFTFPTGTPENPSSTDIYIFFWGNYDGLSNSQKAIYHSLIYYLAISFGD